MYYVTLHGIDSVTERIVGREGCVDTVARVHQEYTKVGRCEHCGHLDTVDTVDTVPRVHQENKKSGKLGLFTLGYTVVQIGLQPISM